MTNTYLHLDAQRRLSLGRVVPKTVSGFLVDCQPGGTIVLTPATPVPDVQFSDAILAAVKQASADVAAGRGVAREDSASGI